MPVGDRAVPIVNTRCSMHAQCLPHFALRFPAGARRASPDLRDGRDGARLLYLRWVVQRTHMH
eukprot:15047726-Alexandrium_andersonii.AAC.1